MNDKIRVFEVFVSKIANCGCLGDILSEKRRAELSACRNEKLKNARYTDWKLLEYAAFRVFGLSPESLNFEKNENGKWSCDRFFFSLSHTDKVVAVAVSDRPCGVDAEASARSSNFDISSLLRVEKYAFTENEILRANESSLEFLKIWTAKESIFKASDNKLFSPKNTDTSSRKTQTFVFEAPALVLSCCGENAAVARVRFVEPRNGTFVGL